VKTGIGRKLLQPVLEPGSGTSDEMTRQPRIVSRNLLQMLGSHTYRARQFEACTNHRYTGVEQDARSPDIAFEIEIAHRPHIAEIERPPRRPAGNDHHFVDTPGVLGMMQEQCSEIAERTERRAATHLATAEKALPAFPSEPPPRSKLQIRRGDASRKSTVMVVSPRLPLLQENRSKIALSG